MAALLVCSNYGGKSVHVAAPGSGILSTASSRLYSGQLYQLDTGTSMAAPFVSGAAALALAASGGTLTNAQVRWLRWRVQLGVGRDVNIDTTEAAWCAGGGAADFDLQATAWDQRQGRVKRRD